MAEYTVSIGAPLLTKGGDAENSLEVFAKSKYPLTAKLENLLPFNVVYSKPVCAFFAHGGSKDGKAFCVMTFESYEELLEFGETVADFAALNRVPYVMRLTAQVDGRRLSVAKKTAVQKTAEQTNEEVK